jgi:hypothetical protein
MVVFKPDINFNTDEINKGYIDIWSFCYEKGLKEMFAHILKKSK